MYLKFLPSLLLYVKIFLECLLQFSYKKRNEKVGVWNDYIRTFSLLEDANEIVWKNFAGKRKEY